MKFPNSFIINKIKVNVTHVLLTKGCVAWYQRHWDTDLGFKFGQIMYMNLVCWVIYSAHEHYKPIVIGLPY